MTEHKTFASREAAADEAAQIIAAASREQRHRPFHLALSGGSSPPLVFDRLRKMAAHGSVDPARFRLFWIDERCVPITDKRSNAGAARRHLGDFWHSAEVHLINGAMGAQEAAAAYDAVLSQFGGVCVFDMALIGVGPDGHVASLFPGDDALDATGLATPARALDGEARVTVTFEVLKACKRLVVLAWGAEKAPTVKPVIAGDGAPSEALSPFARACGRRAGVEILMDQGCDNAVLA